MSEARSTPQSAADSSSLIVVDLGKKQKRKAIKGLRKGTGKLADRVRELLGELREQGAISGSAQPVVVIVRQKSSRPKMFGV